MPGVDVAVQVLGDEGVRGQAVVLSADAPRAFTYDFGSEVVGAIEPTGGVSLRRSTATGVHSVGHVAPPWARDAAGRSVPTHYSVSGGIVTQHITPAPYHAYPVVADPFFIPVLGIVARFTVHALIRMAQRKISQEAVKLTVLRGVRTPGNQPGTSIFTRGSGKDRVRVVVNDENGNIITVTK